MVVILALIFSGCSIIGRKNAPSDKGLLTESKLWQIHEEVRFTHLFYDDGRQEAGLMLRWEPDSIFIQERGQKLPKSIPSSGISHIETITGNRIMEGVALGTLVAAGYFAIVRGDRLGNLTFGDAIAKLLVPPAIIITAVGIGSSKETKDIYRVPPGFVFDYEAAKRNYARQK